MPCSWARQHHHCSSCLLVGQQVCPNSCSWCQVSLRQHPPSSSWSCSCLHVGRHRDQCHRLSPGFCSGLYSCSGSPSVLVLTPVPVDGPVPAPALCPSPTPPPRSVVSAQNLQSPIYANINAPAVGVNTSYGSENVAQPDDATSALVSERGVDMTRFLLLTLSLGGATMGLPPLQNLASTA